MVLHYFSHAARSHFSPKSSNDVILTSSRLHTQQPLLQLIPFYEICQSSTHCYLKKKNKALKPCSKNAYPSRRFQTRNSTLNKEIFQINRT